MTSAEKLNIGIIGAENSHTAVVGKILNIDKSVRGARVTHVAPGGIPCKYMIYW